MDPILNPYEPGAGRRPPELAGRDEEIHRFDVLRARLEQGRSERGLILTGLRGVGKTVLLNEFRARAMRRDWIVAKVEGEEGEGFRSLLTQALQQGLHGVSGKHARSKRFRRALSVFKSFSLRVAPDGSLAVGLDIEPAAGRADTGDLGLDLTELCIDLGETAGDLGVGALVLVDEMQALTRSELAAVSLACHQAGQLPVPLVVVGAGLPGLPRALTEAKSYAERLFEYRTIGELLPDAAAAALTVPARALDVEWSPGALRATLSATRGYPYFLQVFGRSVWDVATASPIGPADASTGIAFGQRELDSGFFGSRWERATPAQRRYLRAVAGTGADQPTVRQVAGQAGRKPTDLSVVRQQLIRKGLLYAPDRGTVAFTVPGMSGYIDRQPD